MLKVSLLSSVAAVAYAANAEAGADTKTEGLLSVAIPENPEAHAHLLAAKLADDKEFKAMAEKVSQAREDADAGPIQYLFGLKRVYGEELEGLPIPGSEGGNNPDVFKIPTKRKDGKAGTKDYSVYRVIAEDSLWGRICTNHIEQCKEAMKAEADVKKVTNEAIREAMQKANLRWLQAELKKWTKRAGANVSNMSRGAELFFAMQNIETIPGVETEFLWDELSDGKFELQRTSYPVEVSDGKRNGMNYTVAQAIRLGDPENIKAVRQKGNNYEALINSLRKGTNGDNTGNEKRTVVNREQFFTAATDISNYLDTASPEGKENFNGLIAQMSKPAGAQLLLATGDLFYTLKDIMASLGGRYERLNEARAAETGEKKEQAAPQAKAS